MIIFFFHCLLTSYIKIIFVIILFLKTELEQKTLTHK